MDREAWWTTVHGVTKVETPKLNHHKPLPPPDDLVVKNLPSNAGGTGGIPGQGIKIPHAVWKLSPCALELVHHNERSHVLQIRPDAVKINNLFQNRSHAKVRHTA